MAGGLGFEPRLTESESVVLPLNYPPTGLCFVWAFIAQVSLGLLLRILLNLLYRLRTADGKAALAAPVIVFVADNITFFQNSTELHFGDFQRRCVWVSKAVFCALWNIYAFADFEPQGFVTHDDFGCAASYHPMLGAVFVAL